MIVRSHRLGLIGIAAAMLGGCFPGDETQEPATRAVMMAAAARCGVPDFEPTPRGDGFAAVVDSAVPDHDQKQACIIDDVEQRQLYKVER